MNSYASALPVETRGVQIAGVRNPVLGAWNPIASYHSSQVLGASPTQLMLMIYEIAIVACGRRDTDRARRAVCELVATLNFDYDEIAVPLFRLYEYCLNQIATGSCEEASKILRGLKQAWEAALQKNDARGERDGLS